MDSERDMMAFRALWNAMMAGYGRGPLPEPALLLEYQALNPYGVAEIASALFRHKRDPERGRYPATAADIVRLIDGIPRENPDAYRSLPPMKVDEDEQRRTNRAGIALVREAMARVAADR